MDELNEKKFTKLKEKYFFVAEPSVLDEIWDDIKFLICFIEELKRDKNETHE